MKQKIILTVISIAIIITGNLFGNQKPDFKVLNSNTSFIELEYTPEYINSGISFLNRVSESDKTGNPDLGYRSFPIFLSDENGNNLEIVDYKYKDVSNIEVKPIGTPSRKDKDGFIILDYIQNKNVYDKNAFFPESFASLTNGGIFRDKYLGHIKIYPVLYNPVTKSIRKLSYLKVRVKYNPAINTLKREMSPEEKNIFLNSAINSSVSINWSIKQSPNTLKAGISNSVLSSGDIYKLSVKESGIYKVDKTFLQNAGINTDAIDPAKIKLFNNGGKELPFNNSDTVLSDLAEIAINVVTDNNGKFDYLLFYGLAPNDWVYNQFTQKWAHYINHFSITNFYYLIINGTSGRRMDILNSTSVPGIPPVESYRDKFFEEPEIINLGSTGMLWLSQRIVNNESFIWNKTLTGYVPNSNINVKLRFGNGSSNLAYFQLQDDNSSLLKIYPVSGVGNSFSHIILFNSADEYILNNGKNMNLRLSLPSNLNTYSVQGYYDYIEVEYTRNFSEVANNNIRIYLPDTTGNLEFQINGFSSNAVKVFDISQLDNPKIINPISYSNGLVRFQSQSNLGTPKQIIALGTDVFKTPVSISSRVQNQNIHGISEGADFIIFSPTEFLEAANRLKAHREQPGPSYLKTLVFDVNSIYNEFSCGIPDPIAMRNFLKYAFNNWAIKPVYVLFFGDGSYDFKNIYNLSTKNWIPSVQKPSDESNEIVSYPSDDFLIEINENYFYPEPGRPDFSTGRICVNSLNEANIVLEKIFDYESVKSNGYWKKKIMYVADDGWTTDNNQGQEGSIHTDQCETIAESYTPLDFEKDKIYIVTYPAVITPQGRRKPGANTEIIKNWNEGRLVINYVGHGSTDLWAHEHVFVRDESIPQMNNKYRYPFVTIASCDLARWDDPFLTSAAEQLVWIKDKGAIGVVAAVRPVFSSPNATFNRYLWDNMMFEKDTLNLPIRTGKSMYYTKNQLTTISDNDAKFCLIGDPTLRVSIPEYFTVVDSINNITNSDTAEVKALQKVRLSGRVLKPDSTHWNNFNGEINLKVFDVDRNIDFVDFLIYHFVFKLDGGIIFSGKTQVKNGNWNLEFIVPKDISYNQGTGKILAYFTDGISEGSGFSNRFKMNGIDTNAVKDTVGPAITLFMDNRNFRSGDIINQNSKIIADFYDFSGINLTGTIGHKIEATFNNDESNKIDLTPYYNSTQGYQFGSLEYPVSNLKDGSYNLKLKAWDTYNNYNISYVDFVVKNNSVFAFSEVYNYPNPMKDGTTFIFQHNWDSPINVSIKVYTVTGRAIKEISINNITDKNVSIDWDGKDADGDEIANGVYLCKIIIKSQDGSINNNSILKLAKLK